MGTRIHVDVRGDGAGRGRGRRRAEQLAVPVVGAKFAALGVAVDAVATLAPAKEAEGEALAAARFEAALVLVNGAGWRRRRFGQRWDGWRRGWRRRRGRWRRCGRRDRWQRRMWAAVLRLAAGTLGHGVAHGRVAVARTRDHNRDRTAAPANAATVVGAVDALLLRARPLRAPLLARARGVGMSDG